MQILVIEDDRRISDFLVQGLNEHNHIVTLCTSAEEVLQGYMHVAWDIVICDIMLPKLSGIQLVETLRYKGLQMPILMLSALHGVEDKVSAFDKGADDYLTKPFHFEELISRIQALTRRFTKSQQVIQGNVFEVGELKIDFDTYQMYKNQVQVELSPREFKLLTYLIQNKNKALSRIQILNAVWGIHYDNQTNVVDVYISYLRSKLDKQVEYIQTIKGVGYLFKAD
jgi:two-component system OmpR family response regulator